MTDFNKFGKLPPQAVDVEEAILGALMLEINAIDVVSEILQPDSFYNDSHKEIYKAIVTLYKENSPIDMLSVTNKLRAVGQLEYIGGAYYISELTNKVTSAANIEHYSRIVADKFMLRKLIELTTTAQTEAYNSDVNVFNTLSALETGLTDIVSQFATGGAKRLSEISQRVFPEIVEASKVESNIIGLSSGLKLLDKILQGFQGGKVYIIAARPGMGKTSLALSIARYMSASVPVGFISLEMSEAELCYSLYGIETQIDTKDIKSGTLGVQGFEELYRANSNFDKLEFYIDDSAIVNVLQLRSKAKIMFKKQKIKILFVDYLQLMKGVAKGNREQEISEISRTIKHVAKELNIPVVALAQLSRGVEGRTEKRPLLGDLRESGSIEQDADVVMFPFRPEYYKILEIEIFNGNKISTKGYAEIEVLKNRGGGLGTASCEFIPHSNTFRNYQTNEIPF